MSARPRVSLPLAELLPLLEASLLFGLQVLIALHPELLAAPEEADTLRPTLPLYGARRIYAALRELNLALESYRDTFRGQPHTGAATDDDIPF
jgi:hypothetical protein